MGVYISTLTVISFFIVPFHQKLSGDIGYMSEPFGSKKDTTVPTGHYHKNSILIPHFKQMSKSRPRGIFSIVVIVVFPYTIILNTPGVLPVGKMSECKNERSRQNISEHTSNITYRNKQVSVGAVVSKHVHTMLCVAFRNLLLLSINCCKAGAISCSFSMEKLDINKTRWRKFHCW